MKVKVVDVTAFAVLTYYGQLSVTGEREWQFDWFDDEDLDNLFAPLLANDEDELERR